VINLKLIQSLERAFNIINCFDEYNEELSLAQISKMTGIHINTARGLVNTLVHYSYIDYDKAKNSYKLGYIFFSKNQIIKDRDNLLLFNNLEDFFTKLANKYQVTTRYHLVKNQSLVRILNEEPNQSRYVLYVRDSMNLPLNATSSGKLILKYSSNDFISNYMSNAKSNSLTDQTKLTLQELSEDFNLIDHSGYSKEFDEVSIGISSVAVPIMINSELMATISATGPSEIIKNNLVDIANTIKDYV